MGLFGSTLGAIGSLWSSDKKSDNAEKFRRQQLDTIKALDWEPEYASEHVGPYQKTQSPVARAYLESFLTGTNPQISASATEYGGAERQQANQKQFDKMYGGWDELNRKQRELDTQEWDATPITRKVADPQKSAEAMSPQWAGQGWSPDEIEYLNKIDHLVPPDGEGNYTLYTESYSPAEMKKMVADARKSGMSSNDFIKKYG